MYRATITSLSDSSKTWGGEENTFETQELAQAWIDKQMLVPGRRKARTEVEPLLDENGDEQFNEDFSLITHEVEYEAEATFEIVDISQEMARKDKLRELRSIPEQQSQVRELCFKIIDLIGRWNTEKELTTEQKDSLMADQSVQAILAMLQAGRPGKAKSLIQAYTPDGTIITEQNKTDIIELLDAILTEYF